MSDKKSRSFAWLKTTLTAAVCMAVNIGGDVFTDRYSVPAMLDSFGTIFAAYALGPFCGALVGCSSNLIVSFWSGREPVYCVLGIIIGIGIGIAARRGFFHTLFQAMSIAGLLTIAAVFLTTIFNIVFYDAETGNVLGDGVMHFLITKGCPRIPAAFIGQFYLDFSDKLMTVVGMYFVIQLIRRLRSKRDKKKAADAKSKAIAAAKGTSALVAVLIVLGSVSGLHLQASAETKEEQGSSFIRTVFNGDNGLSCGHANDVIQTNDGILWVGSYSGLYRYNGTSFQYMNTFDAVKNVNCLFVDSEGRLWIGTNDNGVVLSINESITSTVDDKQGLPNNSVRCITQSSDGMYYIGTSDCMAVARLQTGITIIDKIDDILYAKSASPDNNGNVAVTTAAGKLYILKDGKIRYEIPDTVEGNTFTCCTFADNGELYAGTSDGRMLVFSVGEKEAKCTDEVTCSSLTGLNCIYIYDENTVWVLADNGIGRIFSKKEFEHLETEGFNYSLEKMAIDYQGNLWIASSRMGLMQLSASPFTDLFADYGLESSVVNTTALSNDLIYIGTDGGLIILDTVKESSVENELTKALADARVRCIIKDKNNDLWICSYGQGLIKYTKDGKVKRFDGEEYGIGSRVRVCMELSDGSLAVGGDKGLYFIEKDKVTDRLIFGEDMGAAKVLCLYEKPDGTLLAGTDGNGITVLENRKVAGSFTREDGLTSDVILRMVGDSDKNDVFVATGNGLCYLSDEKITVFGNFPYSNNFDLILDDDGELFVPGSSGIYVCTRDDLLSGKPFDYIILNSKAGLMGSLTSNAWNAIDEDKTVYFSTDRGVFKVNLDAYRTKRRFYRLMISEILLDGQPFPSKRGAGLTISEEIKSVELVPEIVNYTLENPTISYKLEGLDDNWKKVPQSELSHIVYTNLPAGQYEFRLAIFDQETGAVLEECSYSFEKETAIYDHNWFIVYIIAFGGLFVGWLTWFLTRVRLQRTMELQQTKLSLALQQVKMGNETILAIAKTVDAKDTRTSQHSQRVSEYSVMIAEKYGFDADELENLRKSALLHDIGKIGIPDAILNKPARLTDEEYAVMKTHVTRGAEILKDFTLVKHAVDGARYHHERFDGHGYPDHLKGTEIPLYGRIIAVADAFDAMTSNRVYRKKQDKEYVLSELHKGRGTQFDPELLDIFLGLIDSGAIDIDALCGKTSGKEERDGNEKEN